MVQTYSTAESINAIKCNQAKGYRLMRRRRINPGKFLRFIVILALIIAVTATVISSLNGISAKTLKIGLVESSRPLTHVDERRNITGFEAEYAKLIAEKLGKKPEFKLFAPEDLAAALDSGAVDCVVSVRQSVHDYIRGAFETIPFIAYGVVFTKAPKDDTFNGEEDLRNKRVGLIVNSDAEQLCEELQAQYSFDARYYDFEVQPFQDLKLKKNHVVISDELYALYMQKEDPDSYYVLDTVYYMAEYGMRLSHKLTQQAAYDIEEAVFNLRNEIALRDLFVTWFGADLGAAGG